MSDLIDRQAAIDAVLHHGEIENDYTDLYHDGYCDGVYDSADILKDLPSAEPKTGRWMWSVDEYGESWFCSECLSEYVAEEGIPTWAHYCPNCGAKMGGKVDE